MGQYKRRLTSLDLNAKVVRLGDGWQVSCRSTASLDCLLSKWSDSVQISHANRLTHQSTTLTNERRQWWSRAEHCRLKSGPPLMRGMNIYKNIPVSVTELTLGHRVFFITSHLTTDKLFPVNPSAITGLSLLLEAKSMPAFIIKPRPCYANGWPWLVHNVQSAGTDVRSKPQQDCQKAKC